MYAHRSINISVCTKGWKCCQELEGMQIHVSSDVYDSEIRVYANKHRWICLSTCEHPPRNARSFRALVCSSSPAAASALHCNARHRGHMWPVSRVNPSFLRVRSRKRHEKLAAGHILRHTLLTLASVVLPVSVDVLLEALRKQQLLRGTCFAGKLVIFEGEVPQETRETRSRAQSPAQSDHIGLHGLVCNFRFAAKNPPRPASAAGELFSKKFRAQEAWESLSSPKTVQTAKGESPESKRGCHGAGRYLQPLARSLEPCVARCSTRGLFQSPPFHKYMKFAGAPTRHYCKCTRLGVIHLA